MEQWSLFSKEGTGFLSFEGRIEKATGQYEDKTVLQNVWTATMQWG
jgi:hypothetical protein